jgi:hypothetical protein
VSNTANWFGTAPKPQTGPRVHPTLAGMLDRLERSWFYAGTVYAGPMSTEPMPAEERDALKEIDQWQAK